MMERMNRRQLGRSEETCDCPRMGRKPSMCENPTKAGVPRRQKLRKQVSHEVGGSGSCKG